jgi:hypothetical protein
MGEWNLNKIMATNNYILAVQYLVPTIHEMLCMFVTMETTL